MPRKSVVLISGGADSFYAAARELAETDNEVHLHYHSLMHGITDIQRDRCERRHAAQLDRLENYILPWLKANRREFHFHKSSSDYSHMPEGSKVVGNKHNCATVGAYVCMQLGADRLITGHGFKGLSPTGNAYSTRQDMADIVAAHLKEFRNTIPLELEWYLHNWDDAAGESIPKADIWEYLGDQANLTLSCENPKQLGGVWVQCGNEWPLEVSETFSTTCSQCERTMEELGYIPDVRKV